MVMESNCGTKYDRRILHDIPDLTSGPDSQSNRSLYRSRPTIGIGSPHNFNY